MATGWLQKPSKPTNQLLILLGVDLKLESSNLLVARLSTNEYMPITISP